MKDKRRLANIPAVLAASALLGLLLVGAHLSFTNLLSPSSGPIEVSTSTTDLGLLHDTGPDDLGAANGSLESFGTNVTPANGHGGFLGLSNLAGAGTSLLSYLPSSPFRSSAPTTEIETKPGPSPVSPAPVVHLSDNGKGVKLTNGGTAVLDVNDIIDVVDGGVSSSSSSSSNGNKEDAGSGQEPSIFPSKINIKVNVNEAELLDDTINKLGDVTSSIDTTSKEMGTLVNTLKDTAKESKELADGQISAATTRIADHALQAIDNTKEIALKVVEKTTDAMASSAESSLKATLDRIRSRTSYPFLWNKYMQSILVIIFLIGGSFVANNLMGLRKKENKTNEEKKLERFCRLAGAIIFFFFTGSLLAMVADLVADALHVVAYVITNPIIIFAANAFGGWRYFSYEDFLFDE